MDAFFNGRSVADRGTLFNLKEYFRHRSLEGKVMDNFQHVYDFLEVNKKNTICNTSFDEVLMKFCLFMTSEGIVLVKKSIFVSLFLHCLTNRSHDICSSIFSTS